MSTARETLSLENFLRAILRVTGVTFQGLIGLSDAYLKLVPRDPEFQPTQVAATEAEAIFRSFVPDAEQTAFSFLNSVTFVDAGENWAGVQCPYCRRDLEDWWPDAMSNAHEALFENLLVDLPCCARSASLNDLDYAWTVAFASWLLEARNPNRPCLEKDEIEAVSQIVGAPLTQITARI